MSASTTPCGRQFHSVTLPQTAADAARHSRSSSWRASPIASATTPRASVSFQPDDHNTIYLSWSKGFKGGGFDPRGLSTAAPDIDGNGTRSADEIFDYFLFEPEKVTSYEAGYKASLFDRRLRFALAGGGAFIVNVNRQPSSAGRRRMSACQVMAVLAPLLSAPARARSCNAASARPTDATSGISMRKPLS